MKNNPMHWASMRRRTLGAMVVSLAPLAPTTVDAQAAVPHSQSITIVRGSARRAELAPATNFTGRVHVEPLFAATTWSRASGASVSFEPGARAAWHTHPRGQVLIVTAGTGRVQRWGSPIDEIRQGDVVLIPPGVKHWHGAAPTAAMTHIAIQEEAEGKVVDWLEKVSDAQYASPTTTEAAPMPNERTVARGPYADVAPAPVLDIRPYAFSAEAKWCPTPLNVVGAVTRGLERIG